MTASSTDDVREQFLERFALLSEAEGLPRIAGRLMATFLLDGGPISFSQLAERLNASRASISTNTRMLEHYRMIERVRLPGQRQDYFQFTKDPYTHAIRQCVALYGKLQESIALLRASTALPADTLERLDHASEFYSVAADAMEQLIADLQQRRLQATQARQEHA